MSATIETFPSFYSLNATYGFDNAIWRWNEHHREKEAVLVDYWPNDVHKAIHDEVGKRLLEERNIANPRERNTYFSYDRPENRPFWVTPTGGRLHYSNGIVEGRSAPIDPPTDELLLLTWQFLYWQTRAGRVAQSLAALREQLEDAIDAGVASVSDIERAKELHRTAKNLKAKAARIDKKREPLLPRSLREPTPEEAAIERQAADRESARRSSLKRELAQLEL